jgi:hypothetical protein
MTAMRNALYDDGLSWICLWIHVRNKYVCMLIASHVCRKAASWLEECNDHIVVVQCSVSATHTPHARVLPLLA